MILRGLLHQSILKEKRNDIKVGKYVEIIIYDFFVWLIIWYTRYRIVICIYLGLAIYSKMEVTTAWNKFEDPYTFAMNWQFSYHAMSITNINKEKIRMMIFLCNVNLQKLSSWEIGWLDACIKKWAFTASS